MYKLYILTTYANWYKIYSIISNFVPNFQCNIYYCNANCLHQTKKKNVYMWRGGGAHDDDMKDKDGYSSEGQLGK